MGKIVDKIDPRGRKYFWIGSEEPSFLDEAGTDFHAVGQGHVSITPLHLDLTNYRSMETLQALAVDRPMTLDNALLLCYRMPPEFGPWEGY